MAPLPSFPGYAGAPVLGGWLLAMSENSPRREATRKLIRFLTSVEAQRLIALELGYNPTRQALYVEEALVEARPVLKNLFPIFLSARPRPVTLYYLSLSQSAQPEVSALVVGRRTPEEALDAVRRHSDRQVADRSLLFTEEDL